MPKVTLESEAQYWLRQCRFHIGQNQDLIHINNEWNRRLLSEVAIGLLYFKDCFVWNFYDGSSLRMETNGLVTATPALTIGHRTNHT